jgi:hypothetical protein
MSRVDENRRQWGSVQDRADALLVVLREREGIVPVVDLKAATGMTNAMVGGALGDLRQRKLATRHGSRGWEAR